MAGPTKQFLKLSETRKLLEMENYCRTCGKSVTSEECLNLYSPKGRRILHCARSIANCWLENIPGAPLYICDDCRGLVKKVKSFRKRCSKIESFLIRRKTKLASNRDYLSGLTEQVKISDPLRIEATLAESVDIKEELAIAQNPQSELVDDSQGLNDSYYGEQQDFEEFSDMSVDEEACSNENIPIGPVQSGSNLNSPAGIQRKINAKMEARKYTMRVGKRTMYIKLTNEKQPKRIVDRERQWASARPCICEHCGRQFKDGSNLNVHLLRHTGTKNYECPQCNEKCYTLHLLRRHQLKHTEGPYKCTFCGLQYSTNSSRVRHEREACKKGRAPQSKTELIKRGERTFHCDVCDLWFLRAGNLAQHISSSNHLLNVRIQNKRAQLKQKSLDMVDTL